MKAFWPAAMALGGVGIVVAACVIENSTPPYVAPPPRLVVKVAPLSAEAGVVLDAALEGASVQPSADPVPPAITSEAGASIAPAPLLAPELLACAADADCVAVPRNGCCNNGHKEAVNASHVDAYKASFTCPEPRPICPMFRIRDDRTPVCSPGTHQCELISHR
jgi:hypothetical protein